VPGDVNSTLACSLVASKLFVKIGHIEAGLRSNNRKMPEEINRIVTDTLSDYLFVSEPSGVENLTREGVDQSKIFFVGNIMIDNLKSQLPKLNSKTQLKLGLKDKHYIVCTFHRPENVDDPNFRRELVDFLNEISKKMAVVFPMHPRTKKNLENSKLSEKLSQDISVLPPLGYLDFIALAKNSKLVVTDSGGIQEETTFLTVPCVTVRNETERPITVEVGSNFLAGTDLKNVRKIVDGILNDVVKKSEIPELWDGNTATRVTDIIIKSLVNG